jgi:hypothetical protein
MLTSGPCLKRRSQCDSGADMDLRELTDTHRGVAQTRNESLVEPLVSLKSPCLVRVIQMRLPVVGYSLAIAVDSDDRIVVLGTRRPLRGRVNLLWIPNRDGAVVFERGGAGPERSNAGARWLEKGRDLFKGFEVVTWVRLSVTGSVGSQSASWSGASSLQHGVGLNQSGGVTKSDHCPSIKTYQRRRVPARPEDQDPPGLLCSEPRRRG